MKTRPPRALLRPLDIRADGANHGHDYFRAEFANRPGEMRFTHATNAPARFRFHAIHRTAAKIDQVTTQRAERLQKIVARQVRECGQKRVSDRAVKPRIRLIEESAGSRPGFPYKK